MNLNCLNTIITDNLAIHIDISKLNSWNLNNQLTLTSMTKWNNAFSDDLTLLDFGLTAFDNGRVNNMNSGLVITQNDTKLMLYRVGYNNVSGGTYYSGYTISAITGSTFGNYFTLNGGYLQGFFKLNGYNYELLPCRYNKGITIELLLEILPQTSGIFYYMGTRAEDKYNPYFSGETMLLSASTVNYGGKNQGYQYEFTGVTTSEDNYLVSYSENVEKLSEFSQPEYSEVVIFDDILQNDNISNNIISFEITDDKRIKYKYVDSNGNLIQNESPNQITRIGWTIIDIVFKPYDIIANYDSVKYNCYARRTGDLMFYINGRKFWKVSNFNEFYFTGLNNDREKQIGVPFNVSWGGGSFGLKHSWHYSDFSGTTITQDIRKSNLFIEKYFNSSYIGNIQKLRIYDIALESNEVLHNAIIEANSNANYAIQISRGGRIIQQYENITYIPQPTSGSDIRKSIRYRNADGTYKNLYQMLDIKVVVKSRNNPNVELVKFKKVAESGWLALIYMNDTAYDFIVPDTITALHPNEILFAEIKFQWTDPDDIDNVLDKIFIVDVTTTNLLNNTVKNY